MKTTTLFILFLFLTTGQENLVAQTDTYDAKGNPIISEAVAERIVSDSIFEGMDGGTFRISDMTGKIVVLDFWQTWCAPCLASFKGFQKAKEQWPDKIEILAASPDWADSKRKVRRFMRKHEYDFIFIKAYELERELKLSSIPYKIVFAPDGSLIGSVSDSKGKEGEYEELAKLIETWFNKIES
jgi:thiol-disulfide isomerase/thioredoxin